MEKGQTEFESINATFSLIKTDAPFLQLISPLSLASVKIIEVPHLHAGFSAAALHNSNWCFFVPFVNPALSFPEASGGFSLSRAD